MKRLFAGAYVAAILLSQAVFADNFSISKFGGEEVGAPDDYIAAEFNDELKKANPNAIQDGRFYARQKFEDPFDDEATEYGLYEGKITGTGKAKLGKFSVADKPYSDVLKAKFYEAKNSKPSADIERVYFDGKFVYVEGERPIYVNIDGTMTELKPSIEKISYFNVTSQPSGAEVKVNGETKGKSPTKVSVLGAKAAVITLSKTGFYTKIIVMKPQAGQTVEVGELLTEKKSIESPVQPLKMKKLELANKKDSKGLKALRKTVDDKLQSWPSESKSAIDKILASYPPNPSQKTDENADDYQARTDAWQKDRDAEQAAQQAIADKATEDLRSLLRELDQNLEGASFAIKHLYIAAAEIELGRINKGKKQFDITVKSANPELNYTYKTTLELGDMSNTDLMNKKGQLQGVLKVWDVQNDAGKTPAFQGIAFFLNKAPLKEVGKGTYSSTDASPATTATAATNNTKLAALASYERSTFDKEDQSKTQALLQSFEEESVAAAPIPAPVPPPVVVPPPPAPTPEPVAAEEEPAADSVEAEPVADIADATDTQDGVDESEDRNESADDAVEDIDSKFGRGDEYRKWGAWALVATAVGNLTVAVLQHMAYSKAKTSYDNTKVAITEHIENGIEGGCAAAFGNTQVNPDGTTSAKSDMDAGGQFLPPGMNADMCSAALTYKSRKDGPLSKLEPILAEDKKVMKSYSTGRNIFLGLAALSIGGSIVLFTW